MNRFTKSTILTVALTEEQKVEYEGWLAHYDTYYDDHCHLEPQAYFAAMAEIQAILTKYDEAYKNKVDFAELDKEYGARLWQLERMLAV